ncbi:putative hydrolase or acyltransferase of alpha/beta superfamily [Candidatus Methanoperedens nitroreducens]|uniref:Putative hydrolase or acyltransferase of alpha/beta superfamily n=1 Tax=Candidatus Methanoperedens nitratireducens TaxID=1392998 RepID=A0A062V3X6_9EURY|nr:alpha/beta hydrolase [Candidatus Methanoperedens nitroreducens]KCZ70499.1 putative hydrolase or acyltransferase of alpha/beta superfamily [Candidatus Methanoperedens nitroreducens]MDJ1420350.1 alpha/beta hydrolase [Candidatus Methanoperedens sp.]
MNKSQEKLVHINDHKISYLEQGEGSPVILIHGIPTSNLLWRKIMPGLARTHNVFAPDMLNYGNSDKPDDANVSIEAQSRLIVKLMDKLGLNSADVVGHDIGGGVAQLVAVNYPQRVRKLVLIDSVCFDSWPIPEFLPLQKEGAEDNMGLQEFLKMMRDFMPRGVYNKAAMADDVIDLYLAPWSTEEGKKALFRNFRRLNPEYTQAIAGELKHLPHETLILWAEHDEFQKPAYASKLRDTIPDAQLVWIKEAGHWLMEEKPEEVSRHIITFLNKK